MGFEYGSAYDDDAAEEGRPVTGIDAELRRRLLLGYGEPEPVEDVVALRYLRFCPDGDSRAILLLLGKRRYGSVNFDICDRCRRVHIWHLGVLATMYGHQFETRMLQMARAKAPDDYRLTRSGLATCTQDFWDSLPAELSSRPEVPCEHFDWRPGRIRNTWASLKYRRLTGQFIWPDARATHNAVRHSPASREAAPERLGGQIEQARRELAEADRITDARKARKARDNALARIDWLRRQLDELDS
jgi:hypothetical protein